MTAAELAASALLAASAPLAALAALAPLATLAAGVVVAMLLAPLHREGVARAAAAVALLLALSLTLARAGAPPAPLGALAADDGLARLGTGLVALAGLGALVFLRAGLPAREAPALLLLAVLGAAALAGARHAATLFLGLEIVSLALVTLFAFQLSRPGLEAGYKFLVMGGLASAALLLGVALAYAATGALGFAGWHGQGVLFGFGAALLLAGLAFKFALVPFHMWTPDAFEGAPPGAAALAGVVSKVAVAIALLRLGAEAGLPAPFWTGALGGLGAASILGGSLLALRQESLVRMLGYSSIAHSGYVAAILASGSPRAAEAVLFYLAVYAPALLAALCAAAWLGPGGRLEALRGLAWQRPVEAGALSLGLLSLAGLPAAGGFIAKLYLFATLAEGRAWALLAVAIAGSGLGFWYYARFFVAPFLGPAGTVPAAAPLADRALLLACAALILLFGVMPAVLVDPLRAALALRAGG